MAIEKVRMEQVIDEQGNTSVIHPETSSDNVLHMGGTLSEIITLGGKPQTNFNFIENEVVPDGLIISDAFDAPKEILSDTPRYNVNGEDFTIVIRGEIKDYRPDVSYKRICILGNTRNPDGYFTFENINQKKFYGNYLDEGHSLSQIGGAYPTFPAYGMMTFVFIWDRTNKVFTLITSNGLSVERRGYNLASLKTIGWGLGNLLSSIHVYNRILSPKEIAHNFNVLNNSPSLSALETTDSTGAKVKQLFCSDTDHVEDRTGRTQEEINRTFYKRNCKDFVADANGEIKVANGEQGYVLSASIEGQTVKNLLPTESAQTLQGNGTSWNVNRIFMDKVPQLKPSTKYTYLFEIIENTLTYKCIALHGDAYAFVDGLEVQPKQTGVFIQTLTTKPTLDETTNSVCIQTGFGNNLETGKIVFRRCLIEGENASVSSYIPFGLTSTEASITANGTKHTFYEPVIQGLTKIVDANGNECEAGTTGARLVSLMPSVEGLPKFGSVPSISDVLDRGSGKCTLNTFEYELTGDEEWNRDSVFRFKPINNACKSTNTNVHVISDKFEGRAYSSDWSTGQLVSIDASNKIAFRHETITTTSEWIKYLKQQKANGTPVTVRYQLATPEEIQLTPDQVKAYDEHKKPILLPFAEDKFTLNEDGSGTWVGASNSGEVRIGELILSKYIITDDVSDTYGFTAALSETPLQDSQRVDFAISNVFSQINRSSVTFNGEEGIYLGAGSNLYVKIKKDKLEDGTVSSAVKYLMQVNACIKYITSTPTTTHIPKSIMQTIPTDKINILSAGGDVLASKFTAFFPIDMISFLLARIEALEAKTNTQAVNVPFVEETYANSVNKIVEVNK